MTDVRIIEGDCRDALAALEPGCVQTCVTSPPYFGLRDYGHDGQIGLEPTPDEFVAALVGVFREVRRVLRDDGTVWLNLGDSYARDPKGSLDSGTSKLNGGPKYQEASTPAGTGKWDYRAAGLKQKDLVGIPWMVAFALRADGWYLRSDIIWHKPNPMPESVTDRPTKAHEYLFLLSKGPRYYYDADAIKEPVSPASDFGQPRPVEAMPSGTGDDTNDRRIHTRLGNGSVGEPDGRNRRTVWTVATQPYSGAHFATFPPKLIEPCILAGSREGDTALDPFNGAGTTGLVAIGNGRSYIGVELNPEYALLTRNRLVGVDAPLPGLAA